MTADDVADALRRDLESGAYRPGHRLPTVATVSATYGVSRKTAQAAFDALVGEGLISSLRGSGFVVRHPHTRTDLAGLNSGFSAPTRTTESVPAWIGELLQVPVGTTVDRSDQLAEDKLLTTWTHAGRDGEPGAGTRVETLVLARAATPDERRHLKLRAGTPVLTIVRTHLGPDDSVHRVERLTALGAAYAVTLDDKLATDPDHD